MDDTTCEYDDCVCSGDDDDCHEVIDNECDGNITYRCVIAIDADPDISSCFYCEKWMHKTWLTMAGNKAMCYRCWEQVDLIPILHQVLDTLCKRCLFFPDDEIAMSKNLCIPRSVCNECGRTHITHEPDDVPEDDRNPEYEYTLIPECEYALYCHLADTQITDASALIARITEIHQERYTELRAQESTTE